ncbi:hypothetical protein BB560_006570 [Smittium megazygosporum]|uniref:Uncharacterized protein n=1 Tax=Smittium megazygosporum TaxID=133381 RepID=A0A2T9Y3X8_9FUNG|nr:hypothetical protein BB560_006570 [Smittium megazygosporum]
MTKDSTSIHNSKPKSEMDESSTNNKDSYLSASNSLDPDSHQKKLEKTHLLKEGSSGKNSPYSFSPASSPHIHLRKLPGLTIVLKIGTSSVCDPATHVPLLSTLYSTVQMIHILRQQGHNVVLVSSGAVGTGLRRLKFHKKPTELAKVQAVAAVGQGRLMALWDNMFSFLDQPIAQVLLSRNDLSRPAQHVNAYNTFMELLSMGVIPIVNENDTVSLGGIRFGDNDTLSAITAGMIHADYLFLLTDVDCLYTDNPRNNPDAKRVLCVEDINALTGTVDATSAGSSLGTGGMATKLVAAELAMAAGVCTIITHSSKPQKVIDIISHFSKPENKGASADIPEEILCTRFLPSNNRLGDHKWWIKHGMRSSGTIFVDYGALIAISVQKKSLFAAGIVDVEGVFSFNQSVTISISTSLIPKDILRPNPPEYIEIGNGLVNYSSTEISRIKGLKSGMFESILGYCDSEDVIHRGSLVLNQIDDNFVKPL